MKSFLLLKKVAPFLNAVTIVETDEDCYVQDSIELKEKTAELVNSTLHKYGKDLRCHGRICQSLNAISEAQDKGYADDEYVFEMFKYTDAYVTLLKKFNFFEGNNEQLKESLREAINTARFTSDQYEYTVLSEDIIKRLKETIMRRPKL